MFSVFFEREYKKIGFEDMQIAIKKTEEFVIINTLPITEQDCLIKSTISCQMEEQVMNTFMNQYSAIHEMTYIVYGKHGVDETAIDKCKQLVGLGFKHVCLYSGGLFEWLLLQDIYGQDEFPTTKKVLDMLIYKPKASLITRHLALKN
jgi:hypothetical protein